MQLQRSRTARMIRRAVVLHPLLLAGCTSLGLNFDSTPVNIAPPPAPEVIRDPTPLPEMLTMPEPMGPEVASLEPPPAPTPAPKPPVPMRRPPPKPPEPAPARPNLMMGSLIGSDFTAILNVFRSPDTVQNTNLSVVWIYSPPGCTLQLYFYPDIATTTFHLLKYDFRNAAGEVLMSGDPCMQRILAPAKGAAVQ